MQDLFLKDFDEQLVGVKKGEITSRIGLSKAAETFDGNTDILELVKKFNAKNKKLGIRYNKTLKTYIYIYILK